MLIYHGRKLDISFSVILVYQVNELDSLMLVYEVGFLFFVGEGHSQLQCMMQKHRLKLQKQAPPLHMQGYKDKDGTSSGHVESRYEMEHPPMTLLNGFLNTPDPNQLDILSQQQRAPAAIKNTHGFQNLPLPVEANFCTVEGSTICANQNYTLMTQMAQAPLSEQICNQLTGHQPFIYHLPNDVPANVLVNEVGLPNFDTLQGGISGDPGLFSNNTHLPSSSENFGIDYNYIPF